MSELTVARRLASFAALEYEQLKEEQRQRISTRDNLVYATLASLAVLGGAALQSPSVNLLLLPAPVGMILGWTYLMNDQKISAIRRYINQVTAPQVARFVGADAGIFGWEVLHRKDGRRRSRKMGQVAANLTLFCLPGIAALSARVAEGVGSPITAVLMLAEAVGALLLAYQLIVHSEVRLSQTR